MENSISKQLISCKLHIFLSSVMRSPTIPVSPQDMIYLFLCSIHAIYTTCQLKLSSLWVYMTIMVWQCFIQATLTLFNNRSREQKWWNKITPGHKAWEGRINSGTMWNASGHRRKYMQAFALCLFIHTPMQTWNTPPWITGDWLCAGLVNTRRLVTHSSPTGSHSLLRVRKFRCPRKMRVTLLSLDITLAKFHPWLYFY